MIPVGVAFQGMWFPMHIMYPPVMRAVSIMVFVFVGGAILLTLWGRKLRKIAE